MELFVSRLIKRNLQLLKKSNCTFEDIYGIIFNKHNHQVFSEVLIGGKIQRITYRQLNKMIGEHASKLRVCLNSLESGSFVGMFMKNSPNYILVFWALLMIGYRPFLINDRFPKKVIDQILSEQKVNYVISDTEFAFCGHTLMFDSIAQHPQAESFLPTWENVFALSSSGTESFPHICLYNGQAISAQIMSTDTIITANPKIKKGYFAQHKILMLLPLFHIFGLVAQYFWFSFFGATFVFLDSLNPLEILERMRRHHISRLLAVPLFWDEMSKGIHLAIEKIGSKKYEQFRSFLQKSVALQTKHPKLGRFMARRFFFRSVLKRTCGTAFQFGISGGGSIKKDTLLTINALGITLCNGYGSTELGIASCELSPDFKIRTSGAIGRPFPSHHYAIEKDELVVKSKAGAFAIIRNGVSLMTKDQPYYTADTAKLEDNNYYLLGRLDDVIIGADGENIAPDQIEKELNFLHVNEYAILNYQGQATLVIYQNERITEAIYLEISAGLKALFQQGIIINNVMLADHPIIAPGAIKVNRRRLLDDVKAGRIGLTKFQELNKVSNIDIKDKAIFDKIIMVFLHHSESREINPYDNFFYNLGGSSLEYFALLIEMNHEFNIEFVNSAADVLASPYDFYLYITKRKEEK